MRSIINFYGIALLAVIMIPNILYTHKNKNCFINVYKNHIVEALEQIGRYCCFACMCVNIPFACGGFWFSGAQMVYVAVTALLVLLYCIFWIIFWNTDSVARALVLSIIPASLFLFCALMLLYVPFIAAAVLFGICHIRISYMNAVL